MNLAQQLVVGMMALAILVGPASAQSEGEGNRLILLGTKGGPSVRLATQVPSSNALVVNGTVYVIDAGYGASMRLIELGIRPDRDIRRIFITHHHSDHNLELGPLVYNAWAGGLDQPIQVYGPVPVDNMMADYLQSNIFDIETRMADEGRPDLRQLVETHVISEGVVYEDENVTVTAMRNVHPPIKESYAYRFDITGGPVIVFSGDTAYMPEMAEFAKGADYPVHEVMYVPALEILMQRNPAAKTLMRHLKASHTTTDELGKLAAEAGVKNLVLTHFVPGAVK